jgi:hypothetical protein
MNAPTPPTGTAQLVPATAKPAATPTLTPVPLKPNLTPGGTKPVGTLRGAPPFTMGSPNSSVSKWLKMLVYARPGGGKTTLIGTAVDVPEMRDILYIDAEKGDLAIRENPRIKNPGLLMENRVPVSDFMTVAKIHEYLKSHCKFRDENNEDKLRESESWLRGCKPEDIEVPKRFYTVLIDSMTEVDIYCTYGLLGITQEKVLHGESSDIEVARFDEFRKNNQMVQMLCRAFRDLPIHVLAAAHRVYADDELKKRYYSPALTGQLKTQVPGFFDIVGYLDFKKEGDVLERRMYVQPIGNFEAKNRRAVYKPDFFKDPYMIDIMKGCGLLKPELPKENAV